MGLSVTIGMLAQMRLHDEEGFAHYKEELAQLSAYLASEGHAGFTEPETLGPLSLPAHTSSFPYSFLHYLRRAYAHVYYGHSPVSPCPPGRDPSRDSLIDEELWGSHLVCHSDAQGYYVPIDFEDVLHPPEEARITGGMVGSSQQLLRELLVVAPGIGIRCGDGGPSAADLEALAREDETSGPLWRERLVWLALFVVARGSVRYKTAIVFH
jgi:hypothetical protein